MLCVPATAKAQSNAGCDNRVNDTPGKLVPCITTDDLWTHMEALQAIADANPGADGHPSRNSGEPGYKASVDYVADAMRKAGYDVTPPAVHVHLLVLRRNAEPERGLAHPAQLHADQRVEPGLQPGRRDRRPGQAGRSHRHAADADPEFGERLRPERLRRFRGQDRPDPARHVQLRREGAQRRRTQERSASSSSTRAIPAAPAHSAAAWSTPTATRSWRASRWRS